MPRQSRLDTPGALHHVIGRGIDGVDIFGDKKDWMDFLAPLKYLDNLGIIIVVDWEIVDINYF